MEIMRSPLHKGSHTPHPKSAGDAKTNSLEVCIMPKPKWNLNTIYISERLQESLRPISRCAHDDSGRAHGLWKDHGGELVPRRARRRQKATAYIRISVVFRQSRHLLEERAGGVCPRRVRPSCGIIPAPRTRPGGGLLIDDLCHALAGESALLHLHRRLPSADGRARRPASSACWQIGCLPMCI